MDLEKTEELTVSKVKRTLSVILEYANSLALTDLEGNRDKLKGWKRFSTGMAQYYCVEGHEANCDDIIVEKYTSPFERMLEGNREALQGTELRKFPTKSKRKQSTELTDIGKICLWRMFRDTRLILKRVAVSLRNYRSGVDM